MRAGRMRTSLSTYSRPPALYGLYSDTHSLTLAFGWAGCDGVRFFMRPAARTRRRRRLRRRHRITSVIHRHTFSTASRLRICTRRHRRRNRHTIGQHKIKEYSISSSKHTHTHIFIGFSEFIYMDRRALVRDASMLYFILIVCPSRLPSSEERERACAANNKHIHSRTMYTTQWQRADHRAGPGRLSVSSRVRYVAAAACLTICLYPRPDPMPPVCVHLFMFANLRHLYTCDAYKQSVPAPIRGIWLWTRTTR